MELILINERKLKITLSESDMKEYDIDCGTVDYSRTETRRAFCERPRLHTALPFA